MKVFVFVLFFPGVLCCSVLITIIRNVRNLKWRNSDGMKIEFGNENSKNKKSFEGKFSILFVFK